MTQRSVEVIVDNKLRLDGNMIGHDLAGEIMDELIIPNTKFIEAKSREQYGWWDIEEEFFMCDLQGDELVMSRGYAWQLKTLLREHGHEVIWRDRRVWQPGTPFGNDTFSYRPQQPEAVRQMRRHQQGIYKAPTGSGKTVTILGLIWETHPKHSIILVDRTDLFVQWIDRIKEHIGDVEIGEIGGGKWTVGRITVAMVQTLHRNQRKAHKLLKKQSIQVLDECHHATAETYFGLVDQCPARLRLGASATPDKTGEFEIVLNVLGEVFYETTHDELRELGLLVEPRVEVIYTDFNFTYWGDHSADEDGDCEVPGCRNKNAGHRHKNNYQKAKESLVHDYARNRRIVRNIADHYHNNISLVITDQIMQIDALVQHLPDHDFDPDDIFIITGKQSKKQRTSMIESIRNRNQAVAFSTVAGEALDIASINRIHLPFPTANNRKTEQEVGRGTRFVEGKGDVIVFDYADIKVPPFAKQFRKRRYGAYDRLGLKVVLPDV